MDFKNLFNLKNLCFYRKIVLKKGCNKSIFVFKLYWSEVFLNFFLCFTGRPPEVELMFANRMKIPHTFVIHTYTKPTQCQFCKKMLVGVFKQVLIIPPSFLLIKCALCSKRVVICQCLLLSFKAAQSHYNVSFVRSMPLFSFTFYSLFFP